MNDINKKLKVVARKSPLSMLQVEEVFKHHTSLSYELVTLHSFGDKNKDISLMDSSVSDDFFTRELDACLLNSNADIAIHSAKDLPYPLPSGLELYSLTEGKDKSDALVSKGNVTLHKLALGSRIGTSSEKRKKELLALRPDLTIVSIRGTIEERIALVDNGYVDAIIVATCALQRLSLTNRIAQILSIKSHPLQGNLAILGKANKPELKDLFQSSDIRQSFGKVTLVGFGPGNPDLLTIGGEKALQKADIIFHDDLLDFDYLNKYKAEKVYVGKRKDQHSHHQDDINELIYQAAISGKDVVRLKGGDPMVFAHGREEIDFLQKLFVDVSVIPGVSSGIALASYTHIPLTHRGVASSVSFITGHGGKDAQVPNADTLVYYMAGAKISDIAKKLIASGRNAETPIALVHNVSLPNQKTFFSNLGELQYSVFKYPTPIIIIVGNVVAFESKNDQAKVLLTGTVACDYKQSINTVHTPLITVKRSTDNIVNTIFEDGLKTYDWIIFTSRYGVHFFFETLDSLKIDIRSLANIQIASVGETTTEELKKYRIYPNIESATQSAEGIVNYFKENKINNQKILLPRSDKGLQFLSEELCKLNNQITDVPIYKNQVNDKPKKVELSDFQKIVFSSPSGVDAFQSLYGSLPEGIQLVAKGKTTENKLKQNLN